MKGTKPRPQDVLGAIQMYEFTQYLNQLYNSTYLLRFIVCVC